MFKFHYCCGDNVKLSRDRLKVTRFRSFANALCFSQRPIEEEELFLIEIDGAEYAWAGNLRLGITFNNPLNTSIPPYLFPDFNQLGKSFLFTLKQSIEDPFNNDDSNHSTVIPGHDVDKKNIITIEKSPINTFSKEINKKILSRSNGNIERLKPCDIGSRIGLFISRERELFFLLNGVQYGPCAKNISYSNVYVALDLYGNTKQVKIINCCVPKLTTLCKDAIFNSFEEEDVDEMNLPKLLKRDLLSLYAD